MKVLVTGATGFVAHALLPELVRRGHRVRAAARRPLPESDSVLVPDVGPDTDWAEAVAGCDAVVHLAARVHVMRDDAADPLAAFRRVNAAGTRRLAEAAAGAGIRRFVFASTAKVLGEASPPGEPFTDASPPAPADPYAVSKHEAELALREVGARGGMTTASLRPPLVYGPGVAANFLRLMEAVAARRPLPLGAIVNRRSLVYAGNLAAAVIALLETPGLASGEFLVADGEALSTPDLVRRLAAALGVAPRLVAVPPGLLRAGARLAGRRAVADRLLGDFALAPTALARDCGWQPPYTVAAGLAETAAWYRARGAENRGRAR